MTYLEEFRHFCHSPIEESKNSTNVVDVTEDCGDGGIDTKRKKEISFLIHLRSSDRTAKSHSSNELYAEPQCMECGRSGFVVYVELEGGDLLCSRCYAGTLRALAAFYEHPMKQVKRGRGTYRPKPLVQPGAPDDTDND